MHQGILKVKKIETEFSRRHSDQEYKVVTFSVVVFEDNKELDLGLEAERAIFPEWKEYKTDDKEEVSNTEIYKADAIYSDLEVGDLVEGRIVNLTAVFPNSSCLLSIVILNETENPYKRAIKKVNHFPFYLVDWLGRVFKIQNSDDIPIME